MRIGLLTHSILPRGGVVHVLELGRALRAVGHDVTVVAPAAAGQTMFRATPCRLSLAPLVSTEGDFAARIRGRIDAMRAHLARLRDEQRFDVLHAHDGIGANALADLVDARRVQGYLRTVHHVDRFADERVQTWEARSIRAAAAVLCVSEVWRQRLSTEHRIHAQRVTNGVDLERFTPHADHHDADVARHLGLWARGARVLAVGGVESRKNSRRLLAAFIALRRRRPDAQLIVAGGASLLPHDDEARAFRAEAAAAGLAIGVGQAIVTPGALPDAWMPALYRCADVVAMPSLLEGFGLAALEGLACGTPVAVSALAPFTEHFSDADVEWADPLQPPSIAAALERALRRGRHDTAPAVCLRHAWSASALRHDAIYRQFIDSMGPSDARDALPAALAG